MFNELKKYFIYPTDMVLLSAPFWEGIDHLFKIISFAMGAVLFVIAIKRWMIDRKIKEKQLKELLKKENGGDQQNKP